MWSVKLLPRGVPPPPTLLAHEQHRGKRRGSSHQGPAPTLTSSGDSEAAIRSPVARVCRSGPAVSAGPHARAAGRRVPRCPPHPLPPRLPAGTTTRSANRATGDRIRRLRLVAGAGSRSAAGLGADLAFYPDAVHGRGVGRGHPVAVLSPTTSSRGWPRRSPRGAKKEFAAHGWDAADVPEPPGRGDLPPLQARLGAAATRAVPRPARLVQGAESRLRRARPELTDPRLDRVHAGLRRGCAPGCWSGGARLRIAAKPRRPRPSRLPLGQRGNRRARRVQPGASTIKQDMVTMPPRHLRRHRDPGAEPRVYHPNVGSGGSRGRGRRRGRPRATIVRTQRIRVTAVLRVLARRPARTRARAAQAAVGGGRPAAIACRTCPGAGFRRSAAAPTRTAHRPRDAPGAGKCQRRGREGPDDMVAAQPAVGGGPGCRWTKPEATRHSPAGPGLGGNAPAARARPSRPGLVTQVGDPGLGEGRS